VPKAFPAEFRADVIAVARKGEAPLRRIAKAFGITDSLPASLAQDRRPRGRCRPRWVPGGFR
jgi:transposase-like protein